MRHKFSGNRWCGAVVGALLSVSSAPAWAATITVRSTNNAGGTCPGVTCTLRQAIATAATGDTIAFNVTLPGVITLTTGELVVNKNLTISGPGANLLAIDGNNVTRVMRVTAAVTVAISGLTIRNGSTFLDGGGIYNMGSLTVSSSTFSGNDAFLGGGIFNSGGTMELSTNLFSGNSATDGGGVYQSGGTLTLSSSTFSGNNATNSAGGLVNNNGTVTLSSSTFSGNSAINSGGGIDSTGTMTVSRSTFSGNSASEGGSIYNSGGLMMLSSSTFSGNSASRGGGGIYNTGTLPVSSTIIANSPSGGNCAGIAPTSAGDNVSSDNTCFVTPNAINDRITLDPLLNALADNGGPTFTHALQHISPSINEVRINTGTCSGTDQRGVARPIGPRCDIGAVESPDTTPVELQEFVVE